VTETATHGFRRILVALDASPGSLAALRVAADLAARFEAELLGVAVEDVELLRVAAAPLAQEILYHSTTKSPMTRDLMESRLKARSEHARAMLEKEANRANVAWSFHSVKGNVVTEVLAAAGEVDLLAMGKIGWSFGRRHRIGSAALKLASCGIPVLLLSEEGLFPRARWLIQYDGSAAARRAVKISAQLALASTTCITILLPAENQEKARTLRKDASISLDGLEVEIRFREYDPGEETSLLRAVKMEGINNVLVVAPEEFRESGPLESLLTQAEIPILVIDYEQKPTLVDVPDKCGHPWSGIAPRCQRRLSGNLSPGHGLPFAAGYTATSI
jgi:nucleotide-binding universal stress UspA family protein